MSPEYPSDIAVSTPVGTVSVSMQAGDLLCARFGPSGSSSERNGLEPLTVNGIPIRGNLYLRNYGNGFELDRGQYKDRPGSAYTAMNVYRCDKGFCDGPPFKTKTKLCGILADTLIAWTKKNPEVLFEARKAERAHDIERAREEVREAEEALRKAREFLANLEAVVLG